MGKKSSSKGRSDSDNTERGGSPARRDVRIDRRAMERHSAMMGKFLAGKDFASLNEANLAMQAAMPLLNSGALSLETETPLERAQEIMWSAFEQASKKKRISMAKEALEICPDCADAYVLLAEDEATTAQEEIDLYRLGVAAGERALGDVLTDPQTHFWSELITRPYMRSLSGLAFSLYAEGQLKEAIELFQQILRLNPNDNQGMRMYLLPALVWANQFDEAAALLRKFADEEAPYIPYSVALMLFKKHGDCQASEKALMDAIGEFPNVFKIMIGLEQMPTDFDSYAPGSVEEASLYVQSAIQSWVETDGALDWTVDVMARQMNSSNRGARRQRKLSSGRPAASSSENNVLQLNKFRLH